MGQGETGQFAGRIMARWGAVVVALALCLGGCTKYPQVTFENLEYVAALRTACSAKDAEWLAKAKAEIDKQHTAGAMGDEEYAAYGEIVAVAEAGEWADAEAECVRFQKDQLAE